jgi:SAM-dependent methyltransferase
VIIDPHYDIHRDYQTRPVPIYFPDVDDGTTWQPDVYRLLRDLARVMDCQGVIDLGCGQGRKLAGLHPEFAVLGVDTGANLEYCRSTYAFGTWVDANLERPQAQTLNGHALDHRAVVCADVIEHLIDPTGLMDTLRDVLTVAPFAILTTPERDLTHGREHNGPPPNPAHVREWNLAELRRYAESHRLDVAFAGMTASHSASFERKTSLLLLCGRSLSASRREGLVAACEALLGRYDAERAGDRDAWMRQCDALARERDAAHAEAAALAAALTAQRLDTHRTLLRRMLIRVRRARARTVTIVGAGEIGRVASAWLAEAGISTVSIGDNDMQRWGDTWNGLRVCSVAASLDPAADAVIIASVAHARPLRRQVRRLLLRQRRMVRIFSPTG